MELYFLECLFMRLGIVKAASLSLLNGSGIKNSPPTISSLVFKYFLLLDLVDLVYPLDVGVRNLLHVLREFLEVILRNL